MTQTKIFGMDLPLNGHVEMQESIKKGFEKLEAQTGVPQNYTSPGGNIEVLTTDTMWDVLLKILIHIDPAG